ncbi:hypothetical protein HGRIS_004038 [Hohenbuehelia grisea]|uniref:BLOC-1-related complex subunit 5 n=1 Tax=Hohenbuehelia grisea TaxID=104357 RepID=A0ABR3JI36_9AGAR
MLGNTKDGYASPLWAHLLRNNAPAPTRESSTDHLVGLNPPLAPFDKTGTSVRMLLHDTQANFEKFSARVDALAAGFHSAKDDVVLVKTLFEEQNDKLSVEIVDLVNRSQREIQKSLGAPAQTHALELVHKDIQTTVCRLEALDKRMDVMHALHTSQNQTLQALQTQQGAILAALLQLMPLVTRRHQITEPASGAQRRKEASITTSPTTAADLDKESRYEAVDIDSSSEIVLSSGSSRKRRRLSPAGGSTISLSPIPLFDPEKSRKNTTDSSNQVSPATLSHISPTIDPAASGKLPALALGSSTSGHGQARLAQTKLITSFPSRKHVASSQNNQSRQPLRDLCGAIFSRESVTRKAYSSPPRPSSFQSGSFAPTTHSSSPSGCPPGFRPIKPPRPLQLKENVVPIQNTTRMTHILPSPGASQKIPLHLNQRQRPTEPLINPHHRTGAPEPLLPPLPQSIPHDTPLANPLPQTPVRPSEQWVAHTFERRDLHPSTAQISTPALPTRISRSNTSILKSAASHKGALVNTSLAPGQYSAAPSRASDTIFTRPTLRNDGGSVNPNTTPSIRDRRSCAPFAASGRRFIPLDDDDDDD